MKYIMSVKDMHELEQRKQETRHSVRKLEASIDLLNSEPNIENARLAHESSIRAAYAIYEIEEESGAVPTETINHYRSINLRCLEALEKVPVNDGDREHTQYWISLIIRRNDLVSKVKQLTDEKDR